VWRAGEEDAAGRALPHVSGPSSGLPPDDVRSRVGGAFAAVMGVHGGGAEGEGAREGMGEGSRAFGPLL